MHPHFSPCLAAHTVMWGPFPSGWTLLKHHPSRERFSNTPIHTQLPWAHIDTPIPMITPLPVMSPPAQG